MVASKQQKCALAFAGVFCILFGGAIAACGLLFKYHDDYDEDRKNGMGFDGGYQYYYTQYYLGAPLIVLGVLILSFLCCKAKPLLYVCILLSSLTLVLAITAVVLEGPKWRTWLALIQLVDDKDADDVDAKNGSCAYTNHNGTLVTIDPRGLSCKEILYATVMQSIVVGCSILSIVVSQFVAFISIRALGWMTQSSYDISKDRHDNLYNGHSSNVNIMSEM